MAKKRCVQAFFNDSAEQISMYNILMEDCKMRGISASSLVRQIIFSHYNQIDIHIPNNVNKTVMSQEEIIKEVPIIASQRNNTSTKNKQEKLKPSPQVHVGKHESGNEVTRSKNIDKFLENRGRR